VIGVAAVIAAVAAESLTAYVVAAWMAGGYPDGQHAVSAVSLIVAGLVAYAWLRLAANLTFSRRVMAGLSATVTFVTLYGILRVEYGGDIAIWNFGWVWRFVTDASGQSGWGATAVVTGAALLLGVWLRSSVRAGREIELDMLPRSMAVPFLITTVVMIIGAAMSNAGEVGRAGAAFYAVAVVALACSQLAQSGATFGDLRAGGVTVTLLGGVGAAVAVCVVAFGFLFGVFGDAVGAAVWFVVRTVLWLVLTPIAFVFMAIIQAVAGGKALKLDQQTVTQGLPSAEKAQTSHGVWGQVANFGLRAIALLVVIAVVVGLVAFAMSLRRKAQARSVAGPVRSAAGAIDEPGTSWWRSLKGRWSRTEAGPAEGVWRLYRDVLADAEHRGATRAPFVTPGEFAPTLAETFRAPVTDEITAAFEEARYAGREPGARELADLERRWRESRAGV